MTTRTTTLIGALALTVAAQGQTIPVSMIGKALLWASNRSASAPRQAASFPTGGSAAETEPVTTATIKTLSPLAIAKQGTGQQSPVREEVGFNPQLMIAGSGVATLDIGHEGLFGGRGIGSHSQINFSDSSLSIGAAQRLYRNGIGSFTLGGLTTDDANAGTGGGTQFFLHQAFVDFQELRFEAYLGRTNRPAAQIVTFPTIREDDLTDYTSVLNPFSDGGNLEEHRYSNVAALAYNQGLHHFFNVHAQNQIDSAGVGEGGGINSYGANYQYLGHPALASIERVPTWGIGFEHNSVREVFGGASTVLYGGGVLNLVPSVTNRLDLRLLAQTSFGNDTNMISTLNDTYRADHTSIAVALRSLNSPFGRPSSQWSVTAGWKRYSKVSDANSFGAALTFVKSFGQGFDFVSQVGYERRSDGMLAAFGGRRDATVFQIGFVYNFASTFNEQVGPRRSPTNLLHKYIPN